MSIFKFKQFEVDQSGCAMRINTDGVLLAALATVDAPKRILDIGTGTGVIALMLAQRFNAAQIEAVEIDAAAANTAKQNFKNSPFKSRLKVHHISIEQFTTKNEFELIISNPPYFVNDLKNREEKKGIARHTSPQFFKDLILKVGEMLHENGSFWFILPIKQAELLIADALQIGLYLRFKIEVHSDEHKPAFRWMVCLCKIESNPITKHFYIYENEKVYTKAYQEVLKDFFLGY